MQQNGGCYWLNRQTSLVPRPLASDRQMLNLIISQHVGNPAADRCTGDNPLWMALNATGIVTFLGDLTTLTEEDIMNLETRPMCADPNSPNFLIMFKWKTVMDIAAYHHCSQLKGTSIDMHLFPVESFDHFCISLYRHNEKIIPWQVELPSQVNAKASILKSIKPNSKEYKVFRDDKGWLLFRESTEATTLSHNLSDKIVPSFTIDPNAGEFAVDPIAGKKIPYEAEDYGLDEIQRVWFYKVIGDICQMK